MNVRQGADSGLGWLKRETSTIASDLESAVRKSLKTVGRRKFHWEHALQAKRILRVLEKTYGKADPMNLRLADTYARDVFGDAVYAPWLRAYTAFNRKFKEGWIPDNFYGTVVVPSMKGWHGKISNLKTVSRLIFGSESFPDVAYFANGLFFSAQKVAIPQAHVEGLVFQNADRVVYKLDGSARGSGIYIFDRKSFDPEVIRSYGNGVIQTYIEQHRVFSEFTLNSVATLRFTTVVDDAGDISVRSCFLRLGRAEHTHVTAEDEVCVPVDLLKGELRREGYLDNWLPVDAHPDSGCSFEGVKIPAFWKCVATVLELHGKIPFARCVGWDLTVDVDENVKVMEWNAEHNDVKFSEATQGPCFSDLKWERLKASLA
ncbi:conserved hypothetical protein [Paraburkholderia piptadeniae]|uniref:Alpha-L-glutamate ligase-related protein ATP-grasp domain-containing protein n=1 Tax=Paraburkholderia piptadeniae TaxID=1701573 RepID=A0A1N7RQ81_9BURK|nr:conserved hypothetical protein [Paraburkholderia piptadeniae]